MHRFRIKPSTSQPSRRRSATPTPNEEQFFPFNNKKLKVHGWQEDALSIRRFKSNAHISRRNYEFIPILKGVNLEDEKISIVKSAKNQYNIFMKTQASTGRTAQNIDCINGVKSRQQGGAFCNSKLLALNNMYCHRTNKGSIFGNKFERFGDLASTYSGQASLHVSGESKCLSPSKSGQRFYPPPSEEKLPRE